MAVENLITEHIDVWTSAEKTRSTSGRGSSKKLELYGVKKLRELIFELAVRGKLVPQDSNDEPVATLLKQNHIEQSRLTVEENLKTKASQSILDSEEYILVPETWGRIKLGNLAKFIDYRGKTPKKLSAGVRLITAKNVKFGYLSLQPEEFISEAEYKTWMTRGFPRIGDILFTPEAPLGNVAQVDLEEKFALAQRAICLQFHLSDISNYLRLFLMSPSFQSLLSEKATGTTAKGIKASVLKELVVYIPPIEEQHRIVAKVDELMALCDQLEQQTEDSIKAHQVLVTTLLDTLTNSADTDELMQNWARISEHFDTLFTTEESIDQLKQTILQLAVMGKLVSFGNSRKTMLKELLSFGPRNGLSPKEAPSRTELKVLKLGATSYGSLDLEQSKYVDVDVKDKPYLCLTRGDILIQRGNSANFVGSNVLIQEDHYNYIYPDLMMKLRVNQLISPEFLSLVLSAKTSREHMWKQMTGTSGTMPKISKKVVEGLPITFPTNKNIQAEVVSQANKLIALCDKLRTRLTDCSETKATLCDVMTQQAY